MDTIRSINGRAIEVEVTKTVGSSVRTTAFFGSKTNSQGCVIEGAELKSDYGVSINGSSGVSINGRNSHVDVYGYDVTVCAYGGVNIGSSSGVTVSGRCVSINGSCGVSICGSIGSGVTVSGDIVTVSGSGGSLDVSDSVNIMGSSGETHDDSGEVNIDAYGDINIGHYYEFGKIRIGGLNSNRNIVICSGVGSGINIGGSCATVRISGEGGFYLCGRRVVIDTDGTLKALAS